MFTKNAQLKAALCTAIFAAAGLYAGMYLVTDWIKALPALLLYAMLVIHAYYSVRIFASITPATNITQQVVDIILFFLYFAIAINISSPSNFTFFSFLMFIVAMTKYILLLKVADYPALLHRKIYVDLAGVLGFGVTFLGVLAGYPKESMWLFAGLFFIVSIFLFFIRPLYVFNK